MSDGLGDVGEVLEQRDRANVKGYCFYHSQDLDRAMSGGGLMLAFGDLDDDKHAKVEIGRIVKAALEAHGFAIEWNGDSETRLDIPSIDWKRRRAV